MGSPVQPIALQVQTPQPASPLQTIGSLMQLRSGLAEQALRAQQIEQSKAQTANLQVEGQQRARDLQDQNTYQESMGDPAISAKVHAGDFSPLESKIQPKNLDLIQTAVTKHLQDLQTLTKDKREVRSGALGELVTTINGLKAFKKPDGTPDLDAINSALPGAIGHLTQAGVLRDAGIDTPPSLSITDPKQLDQYLASVGGEKAAIDQTLAQEKTKAETGEAAGKETQSRAAAAKDVADTEHQTLINNLMKSAGSAQRSGPHPITSILGDIDPIAEKAYHVNFDEALAADNAAGHPDHPEAAKVLAAAVQHAAMMSPTTMKNKADTAAAEARAKAPIETQTGIATAVGKEKALAALAPTEVQGIYDPSTRNKVMADRIKAGDDYSKSASEAQQVADYVDAAKSGNQAAAANIPLAAVRALVNRVNRTELENQGGQSFARRILDYADKGIEGHPSEQTLQDFKQLSDLTKNKAGNAYAGTMDNLNAQGARFPRNPPNQATTPAAKASVAEGTTAINPTTKERIVFKGGKWVPQ